MQLQIDSAADQAILTALRRSDWRQAADLMVRYYGNAVFNLCYAQVDSRETAEDLTQATFGRAFSSLRSFHGDTSTRAWLILLARECCLEHLAALDLPEASQEDLLRTVEIDSGRCERLKISDSLRRRLEILASAL